jgi:alkylation response protein AidB-like acyl-CoA dehydrogenase
MIYRTVGMIEEALSAVDKNLPKEVLKAIEDYAIECSVIKVTGSEWLGYACDEAVQVFGGNGYSRDYPVERAYRDARIGRIYEGTNEINRLIIAGQLLRRAAKGENQLFTAAKKLQDEMLSPSMPEELPDTLFAEERAALASCKKAVIAILGSAALKYRDKATEQQEVLAAASDMIMDVLAMESAILRTEKLASTKGEAGCDLQTDATRVFASDAIQRVEQRAKTALAAMSEGDELRMMLGVLRRYMKYTPFNTVAARRRIADSIIEAGRYNL